MQRVDSSPLIYAITPSDTTRYDPPLKGIRAGVAGDIVVRSAGENVTITAAQIGEHIPGEITQVLSTGTTATSIIGWRWNN